MSTISLRDHIGAILSECAIEHQNLVVLDSDLAKSTTTNIFQRNFPDRFIQTGIAEQSAMSIAHGLSYEGLVPFYVNFSIFATGTCWTQLRQICYSKANVKVIGTHPGLDNGPDGATHHAIEDLAITRSFSGLTILVPSNLWELKEAIHYSLNHQGPIYIRVARDVVWNEYQFTYTFTSGEPVLVHDDGKDVALIFEGTTSLIAFETYEQLKQLNLRVRLINIRFIKPLNAEKLIKLIGDSRLVVTIENHSVIGGLGTLVAELLFKHKVQIDHIPIGVNDTFTESGQTKDVKGKYGISTEKIVHQTISHIKHSQ